MKKPLKVVDKFLLIEFPSEQEGRKEPRKSELGTQIRSTKHHAKMRIKLNFYV